MRTMLRCLAVVVAGFPCLAFGLSEIEQIEALVQAVCPDPNLPGGSVVAMRNGEIVFAGGCGTAEIGSGRKITADTPIRIASVSKQFTAMAIMILKNAGKISFDDPVTNHVADFPEYGDSISIRNLLNHTSGIVEYEHEIPEDFEGFVLDRDILEILKRQDSTTFPPGTKHKYSNSGYALLAVIMEEVSGLRYDEFMRTNVFEPLGMTNSMVSRDNFASIPNRAIGHRKKSRQYSTFDTTPTSLVMGDGGIYSTAHDIAQWERGLRENTLVSSATLNEAYTGGLLASGERLAYGFGWEVFTKDGVLHVGHSGNSAGFGADFRRIPEKGLAVAVLMNRRSFTDAVQLGEKIMAVLEND